MADENTKVFWNAHELLAYERACARAEIAPVPGAVREDVLIPASGFLRARRVRSGEVMRIIDVAGQQVADVIFYDAANLDNVSSMTGSVLINGSWKLSSGHSIYSKLGNRMATITDDSVGCHAALVGFCTPHTNEVRYGIEGTHSCRLNFVGSMSEFGLRPLDIEDASCLCPFMNVAFDADGRVEILEPISKPGDYIDLTAEMDLVVALSNCPSEHNPCNAWNPSPLRVVIYEPEPR